MQILIATPWNTICVERGYSFLTDGLCPKVQPFKTRTLGGSVLIGIFEIASKNI